MEEKKLATEANAATIAPQEEVKVITSTEDDLEAKFLASEQEKARIIEERDNYKKAYLKEKGKKEVIEDDEEESDEDKMRRIANETLANSRIAEIAQEQDAIIKRALKENKELKLANMNRTTTPSATIGAHSEAETVKDNFLSPEQLAALPKNWNEKDIERFKSNLRKSGGR